MITCIDCNSSLINVFYKCTSNDYRYVDYDDNLISIKMEHNIDQNYSEINTQIKDIYCVECNSPVYYPTKYQNNKFINNDIEILYFPKFEEKNLIHKFTNINCKYCNNLLQPGYFNIQENKVHIYNEDTSTKIKDINIISTDINLIPETDIGKKIIYCPDCNFFIMNNLQEFYKI